MGPEEKTVNHQILWDTSSGEHDCGNYDCNRLIKHSDVTNGSKVVSLG